jgi:Tfp pilus assembly protein PilP
MRVATIMLLCLPAIAVAESVRYEPMPRMRVAATQVDGPAMLHLQAEIRGVPFIGLRRWPTQRLDIEDADFTPIQLRDHLLSRLNLRFMTAASVELATAPCIRPGAKMVKVPADKPMTINYGSVWAPVLLGLAATEGGYRKVTYPETMPAQLLAVRLNYQKASDILNGTLATIGAEATPNGDVLEVRRTREAAPCTDVKWQKSDLLESTMTYDYARFDCASIRPNGTSRDFSCQWLEQFPMEKLEPRGFLQLTESSPLSALIESPDFIVHRVRLGDRLGRGFNVVTGMDDEYLRITNYSLETGKPVARASTRLDVILGESEPDAEELATQKAKESPPHMPYSAEEFRLQDLLFTGINETSREKRAVLRDVYGGAHLTAVGRYVGTQLGRVVEIKPDRLVVDEVVSDNLGGYMERMAELKLDTWYELPRAVIKRKYQAHLNSSPVHAMFVKAARDGDLRTMEVLLRKGAKVDDQDGDWNALYGAAHAGKLDAVRWLVAHGARPGILVGEYESTPLHAACDKRDIEAVRLLLDAKADVDLADKHENTPLMDAARTGQTAIAKLLLSRGANPRAQTDAGLAPFTLAAAFGNFETIEVLLSAGISLEERDRGGHSMLAASMYNSDVSVAKRLIARGADVNSTNNGGLSVLDIARQENADAGLMALLVGRGAKPGKKAAG